MILVAEIMNISAIDKMSREDFYRKMVCGFAQWEAFSRLVCLGPSEVEKFEMDHLRAEMEHAGISGDAIKTEMDLYGMCRKIAERAMKLA